MPENKQPGDILRQLLDVARKEYADRTHQDQKTFDLDAATELIFYMTGSAPQATVQWLHALAHVISVERRGGDLAGQRAVYAEACRVLHETLTKPTITN